MNAIDKRTGTEYRLESLTRSYGNRTVVGPIDLTFKQGDKVAIIGPSGAGKTTLLRLIAGVVSPTTGRITLRGTDSRAIANKNRFKDVGFMHQQLDLIPQLTARKNIEVGNSGRWSLLRTFGSLLLPVHDNRSERVASFFGLSDFLDVRTSLLSGGQQQRVALARLLVQAPALHLADEPVSALDPSLADKTLQVLCGRTGIEGEFVKTVVANIHAPELAVRHFDRVIGLRDGSVIFDKPASEVTDEDTSFVYDDHQKEAKQVRLPVEVDNWGRD
ncbi:MAG: phosphonate ABC transporter ATP-binding protein [Dehalococcoidia bacterium]|jgi:phosphonate transport system ATP-binding protein